MEQFRKSRILYTGEPPALKKSRFYRKSARAILSLILFILFVVGATYLLRLPQLRIHEIRVEGTKSILEDDIRSVVFEALSGNIFHFIPKDNYFLVSSVSIEKLLNEKFSKIAKVDVHKNLPPALSVKINERDIWGIVCVRTEIEEVSGASSLKKSKIVQKTGPCFYIDRLGFAFEDVSSFEGGLLPIVYKNGSGAIGENVIGEQDILFFEEASRFLSSSLQLALLSLELSPEDSEDARLALKEGWTLLVPRNKPPSTWVSVLKTLLVGEIKDRSNKLDYVDLRFGNKVFYKFR